MTETGYLQKTVNALNSTTSNAKRAEIFNKAFERLDVIDRGRLAGKYPDLYNKFADYVMQELNTTKDNAKQDVFNKLYPLLDLPERDKLSSQYPNLSEKYNDFFIQSVLNDISKDLKARRKEMTPTMNLEKTVFGPTGSLNLDSSGKSYSLGKVVDTFMPKETGIRRDYSATPIAYNSIFKNKIEQENCDTARGGVFVLQESLPLEIWKQVVGSFDGSNIRSGTGHWWSTATEDDKPSARPKITKSGIIHMHGIDFTEGRLSAFLAISKDGKELYVDNNGNADLVSHVLKKNGVSFTRIGDAYLNLDDKLQR